MDKKLQNFIDKARSIKMAQKDKFLLRAKLLSLPVPSPISPMRSPYISKSHFWTLGKALIAACLIVILGGGSLSYAAEKSLPGDRLYPVKTNFNEEIVSNFKFTSKDKIAWQEKRVERRLKEIEELSKKQRLNEHARSEIEDKLKKHLEKIHRLKIENKVEEKDDQPIIMKAEKARLDLKNREEKEDKENSRKKSD